MTQTTAVASGQPFAPAEAAQALWHDITSGSFRIVNWYDREGRRYVVARPVAPEERVRLTARQRKVLALRSAGHAYKNIAFELGVSLATVAREMETAMKRLGLESTAALAAVLGHVAA